jgi:hypothetical protein
VYPLQWRIGSNHHSDISRGFIGSVVGEIARLRRELELAIRKNRYEASASESKKPFTSLLTYLMKLYRHLQHIMVVLTFGCVGFTSLDTDNVNPSVETFSKLPATDTLHVLFSAQGCFGGSAYELTFQRGSTTTVIVASGWRDSSVENKLFWSQLIDIPNLFFPKKRQKQPDRNLGQVTLTNSDLNGLDELLRFYRSSRSDNCTKTDTIEISQIRDSKTIALEKFTDESCDPYKIKNVKTFLEIARRSKKSIPRI